jgi:hypothetical protein
LNKNYKEWMNDKTTISAVEEVKIELPTGIDKIKLTTNAPKILKMKVMSRIRNFLDQ